MAKKNIFNDVLNEDGQSTVEYILLLAVVMSLFAVVFKSDAFNNMLGEQGSFFQAVAGKMEFSYRNGFSGNQRYSNPDYSQLAGNPTINRDRFFSPRDPYPSN